MFQAAMEELGVEVKVEELELATWIDRIVTTDEYDISWDYHFQRAVDPGLDAFARLLLSPGTAEHQPLSRRQMTELISPGRQRTRSGRSGRSIYFQFQERWNEYRHRA